MRPGSPCWPRPSDSSTPTARTWRRVRAVADAVGTTTRAVYSVFGSKHGLLEALATPLFEVLSDAIDAVPRTEDVAGDLVEAGVRAFRQTALDHPSLYRLVFVQVVPDLELGSEFGAVATAAFAAPRTTHRAHRRSRRARRPLGRRRRRRVPLLDRRARHRRATRRDAQPRERGRGRRVDVGRRRRLARRSLAIGAGRSCGSLTRRSRPDRAAIRP